MDKSPLISIYMQVYNTEKFLPKAIESVLNQTYTNFEFYIIDNGSTDSCRQQIINYELEDTRVKRVRFEDNQLIPRWLSVALKNGKGQYLTNLDSDDWWEPDYLEKLVNKALEKNLDIVCTGSYFHVETTNTVNQRAVGQSIILTRKFFSDYFPAYHVFFRTTWAKLVKMEIFRSANYSKLFQVQNKKIGYGLDTVTAFAWLGKAEKICIDNSVLHHYLVRKKSGSYLYNPNRFQSDLFLYQDAIDFLSSFGSVSEQNLHFLSCVYGNAVCDTLNVINNAKLPISEKLKEVQKIVCHPITVSSFQYADSEPRIKQNKKQFLTAVLTYGEQCPDCAESFYQALQSLCPKTGVLVEPEDSSLFLSPAVLETLIEDSPEKLRTLILDMVSKQQNTKQYNLGGLLQNMTPERSLAHQVDDVRFIRKYRTIYENLFREDYISILNEMTELLLNHAKIYNEEFFLNTYISAAALTEQVPAFLFGKTQLAQFYLQHRRKVECQLILKELDEMGVESEEFEQIREQLTALDK